MRSKLFIRLISVLLVVGLSVVTTTAMTGYIGKAPEPQGPEEPELPVKESKGGMGSLLMFMIVALAGGGRALHYFKFRKPKAGMSCSTDLSGHDFDDETEEQENE